MHTSVAGALGQEIVDGVLEAGDVLTLEQIQARFGVSRTVAREAMRLLESMRTVTAKRRVGVVVLPASEWDVFNPTLIAWRLRGPGRRVQLRSLTELRAAVEPVAAGSAARHADADTRALLVPLAARMRVLGEAGDLEGYLALDIEFHATLLRSSGNELFAALSDLVAVVLTGRTRLGLVSKTPAAAALDAHEAVARAVRDGDPEAAERAMSVITAEVRRALDRFAEAPVAAERAAPVGGLLSAGAAARLSGREGRRSTTPAGSPPVQRPAAT